MDAFIEVLVNEERSHEHIAQTLSSVLSVCDLKKPSIGFCYIRSTVDAVILLDCRI